MIYQLDTRVPRIHNGGYIAENATVIGNVELASKVTIWFGAVLRGDIGPISIGKKSNVQDNATIHTDYDIPCIVGENVTIGHNAILHSCTISDNVIVGMGSVLLNHVRIGKNCIIGANSLVTHTLPQQEGVLIMGQPAKVIRKLTPEEIAHIQTNADHYVENGKRYDKQLIATK